MCKHGCVDIICVCLSKHTHTCDIGMACAFIHQYSCRETSAIQMKATPFGTLHYCSLICTIICIAYHCHVASCCSHRSAYLLCKQYCFGDSQCIMSFALPLLWLLGTV